MPSCSHNPAPNGFYWIYCTHRTVSVSHSLLHFLRVCPILRVCDAMWLRLHVIYIHRKPMDSRLWRRQHPYYFPHPPFLPFFPLSNEKHAPIPTNQLWIAAPGLSFGINPAVLPENVHHNWQHQCKASPSGIPMMSDMPPPYVPRSHPGTQHNPPWGWGASGVGGWRVWS